MPRRSELSDRVGLNSIVRASRSSKLGNVAGPRTKSWIALAFSPVTPGVMSTSTSRRTRSGRAAASAIARQTAERHPDDQLRRRREHVDHLGEIRGVGVGSSADTRCRAVGVAVAGQIGRDERPTERQRHGVPGVGVLRATVDQDDLGRLRHPNAASSTDRPSSSPSWRSFDHRRHRRTAAPTRPRSRGTSRTRRTRPLRPSARSPSRTVEPSARADERRRYPTMSRARSTEVVGPSSTWSSGHRAA